MTYALPPIAVTGEIITAAWGNDVRNALAALKTGLTSDVGSNRATLDGTAAVDTGIARPALVGTGDNWGIVNFGDYTSLVNFTTGWFHNNRPSTWETIPVGGAWNSSDGRTGSIGIGDDLYFGHSAKFSAIEFKFVTPSGHGRKPGLRMRYWNGSAWAQIKYTDTTQTPDEEHSVLSRDGLLSWDIPSDWARNAVNGVANYWIHLEWYFADRHHGDGYITRSIETSSILIEAPGTTGGLGRDAEWPIIRLNDLHDTNICPAVSVGDELGRANSLVFTEALGDIHDDGVDAYLAVLSNGNLAIGVSAGGIHALPCSIKTLNANRLA